MSTNAERQRKYRQKLKTQGIVRVQVELTKEGVQFLRDCYDNTWRPGNSMGEFYERCLIRGAAFMANTGKGKGKRGVPAGALRCNATKVGDP